MIKPIHKCFEEDTIATIPETKNQTGPAQSFPEPFQAAISRYYSHLPENLKISIGILSYLLFSDDDTLNRLAYDILANSEKAARQIIEKLEFAQRQNDMTTQEACIAPLAIGLLLADQ